MNKLRQALGDSANQPRYIETLPSCGYRFVAPVHTVGGAVLELVQSATKQQSKEEEPQTRGLPLWAGWAAALLLVLLGASWMLFHRWTVPPVKPTRFLITPPRGYHLEGGGIRQSFASNPDQGRGRFAKPKSF